MKCKDCGYWYKEDSESYPRCHYEGLDDWAPCNYEEPDYSDYDDCVND